MNAVAHCRIGRVRMKRGGADLYVLDRPHAGSETAGVLRAWMTQVLDNPRMPDAFACVAFVWCEEESRYLASTIWDSTARGVPVVVLPDMIRAQLRGDIIAHSAEHRVLRILGYQPVYDPDDVG